MSRTQSHTALMTEDYFKHLMKEDILLTWGNQPFSCGLKKGKKLLYDFSLIC